MILYFDFDLLLPLEHSYHMFFAVSLHSDTIQHLN